MIARAAGVLALALAACACAGDGVVTGMGEPPTGGGPTLASLQTSIFTPTCAVAGCHLDPGAQQGLDLSAGKTYAHTVGVDVTETSGFKRVVAGSSADSYLYMKVSGDPRIVGERMPFGGSLTAAEIDAIREWIDAGAAND